MKRREEERRVLELVLADSQRELEVLKAHYARIAPAREREVAELREQVRAEKEKIADLEARLERPQAPLASDTKEDHHRIAIELAGVDPTLRELEEKARTLEEQLERQEAKLKQKRVLLEELEKREAELVQRKEEGRAEVAASLAKVNEARTKASRLDEKILATLAELSLYRAHAAQLEQAAKDLSVAVEQARGRVADGKAPTVDDEREWYNLELRRQLRLAQLREQQEKAAATRRYSTYIPDDGIGLPK
jgi:chromosome segregation ATPase